MGNKNSISSCDMHEALVSYLYNEATAEDGRRVEAHLNECGACKQELASFEQVRGMLQHWQLDDLPVVRVETARRRPAFEILRELFTVTPWWAKALGAMATACLVLAIMGTEVSIGRNGFSMRADLIGRQKAVVGGVTNEPVTVDQGALEQMRAEMKTLVNSMIGETQRQQKAEWQAQLVSLESQIQNMHAVDLAKLAAMVQQQRAKIKTLERDIDRREGLDLTDILFSELTNQPNNARSVGTQGGD